MHRIRIKHHVEPAIVGLGCVLAGAPGLPVLTKVVGQVALEQGRVEDSETNMRSLESQTDEAPVPSPSLRDAEELGDEDGDGDGPLTEDTPVEENSLDVDGKGRLRSEALTQSQKMREAAQTTPSLSRLTSELRRSIAIDDPFGQLDAATTVIQPFQSSPAISNSKKSRQSGSSNLVEALIQEYDIVTQRHLLQAHYCRSEVCVLFSYLFV